MIGVESNITRVCRSCSYLLPSQNQNKIILLHNNKIVNQFITKLRN